MSQRTVIIAAVLGVAVLAVGCHVVVEQDLRVEWSIAGTTARSACTSRGIDHFRVSIDGPELRNSETINCSGLWVESQSFRGIREGLYTVTVQAFDSLDRRLGGRTVDRFVDGALASPVIAQVDLREQDFGGSSGGARIDVLWNINGTVDSSPTSKSWDSCAEVGATKAAVFVDGELSLHDCAAGGNMSTSIEGLVAQQGYQVEVELRDAAGKALTTRAKGNVVASAQGGQLVGDFFYEAFYDEVPGNFRFTLTFGGKSCTDAGVDGEILALRKLDDSAVAGGEACDSTLAARQAVEGAPLTCSEAEQALASLPWGEYKLTVQGQSAADGKLCFAKTTQILIGAGVENPLITIDVDADKTTCP